MKTAMEVQTILEDILGNSERVYFQPPKNIQMKYPCIVYERGAGYKTPADNKKYLFHQGYRVTYITKDPDAETVPQKLLDLPYSQPEQEFKNDNLYHRPFFIYF